MASNRYAKKIARGRIKHVLPVAAETAGIMRGIAKSAEVSLDEQGIRETQGIANNADHNLKEVLNGIQMGPFMKLRAKAVVRKGIKSGMKQGKATGSQIFKSPKEMGNIIRKDLGR